jgi:hypothetical protein
MEYPFEIYDDINDVRNDYNIVPGHPEVVYIDIVNRYICGYNNVEQYYSYCCKLTKTLVDTRFVSELVNFMWYDLKTNHSTYYIGRARTDLGKEILTRFNRKSIEMHTLLALLAKVPNPNNYQYVDHYDSLDNRVENLFWSPTKPYKLKHGIDIKHPDDVTREVTTDITWHITNETGPGGDLKHKTFFRVDHPYLRDKSWVTSKSSRLTNQEKLDQAINKYHELNKLYTCPIKRRIYIEREKFIELIDEYDEQP